MTQARTLNERYELQAKIGDGGMAAVYKALDLRLNRVVAIKILRDTYATDPQFLARFKREAQQSASLNHPNVVRVFDVGEDGGVHYIVMEYVDGSSLKEVIQKQGPLPIARALEITAEICDGIASAHALGLIHRDIKPQNILLDKTGKAKVTDFGIAKSSNTATLTEAGITMGTVHYFSPEQARGQQVVPQSDIYSIGIVLFEMLTGQIPFDSDTAVALAMKHIEEPPPPPRRLNPSIPPVVEQIVLRALAKDPSRRFSTAEEMSRALRTVLSQTQTGQDQGTMAVRPTDAPRPATGGPGGVYAAQTQINPPQPRPQPNPNYQQPYAPQTQVNPPQPQQVYTQSQAAYQQPVVQPNPNYNQVPVQPVVPVARPNTTTQAAREAVRTTRTQDDYEDNRVRPAGDGGCLPWFIGGVSFVMIAALIIVGFMFLPSVLQNNGNQAVPTNTAAAQATSTSVPVAKVKVPNVLNRSQAEAEKLIKDSNLEVGEIRQEFNAGLEAGRVLRTEPAIGTEVGAKSKVALIVSRGQEQVALIDYTNTDANAAQKQLQEVLGLKVERIEEASDTVQKGAVIRTEPKGGKDAQAKDIVVGKGTTVKLFVSKGPAPTATPVPPTATPVPPTATPRPVTVPSNLTGKTRAEAEKSLKDVGLVAKVEEWDEAEIRRRFGSNPATLEEALRTYNALKKGDVLGTDPPGGTNVTAGKEVIVAIKK